MHLIDTRRFAATMRAKIIRPDDRRILISKLVGSDQEDDITLPPNCGGYGRIRHFRRVSSPDWPANPLPIDPASMRLRLRHSDMITAQVFQNAGCAWRCWYCFVPFELLNGNEKTSAWFTADELVALYESEPLRAPIIDLSGGSPDLTPEWVIWMMKALERAGLSSSTYLWSDDNLSADSLSMLAPSDLRLLRTYRNYGRVCCFKGYDEDSFVFNTHASLDSFSAQFDIFRKYLRVGFDLYGYATITGPDPDAVPRAIPNFFDRLQALDERLPLRVVPLQIQSFGPMMRRSGTEFRARALATQAAAITVWNAEMAKRFSHTERSSRIFEVELGK